MRTKVSLSDDLYRRAKVKAAEEGTTFSGLVAEALERKCSRDADFELIVSGNKGGLAPGLSLERMSDILDLLDEDDARS